MEASMTGKLIAGRWLIGDTVADILGAGTFAEVRRTRDLRSGALLATKCIQKCRLRRQSEHAGVAREVAVLSRVHHRGVIRLVGHYEDNDFYYVVLEFWPGGDVCQLIEANGPLPERRARHLFQQMLDSVMFLHRKGVCVRDVKADNFLLDADQSRVCLIDLGLCDYLSHELFTCYCGSPSYAAPELVSHTPYRGAPNDCWGLGVTLYYMLFGRLPFTGEDLHELFSAIRYDGVDVDSAVLSEPAKDLLVRMLTKDPDARITLADVKRHPWVRGHGEHTATLPLFSRLTAALTGTPPAATGVVAPASAPAPASPAAAASSRPPSNPTTADGTTGAPLTARSPIGSGGRPPLSGPASGGRPPLSGNGSDGRPALNSTGSGGRPTMNPFGSGGRSELWELTAEESGMSTVRVPVFTGSGGKKSLDNRQLSV